MLHLVLSALCLWSWPVEGKLAAASSASSQTLCGGHACYTAHLERRPFHKALEICQANGGSLASLSSPEEALRVRDLLGSLPPAPAGAQRKFWMGLQLLPRHCYQQHKPLRGFSWTAGGEATRYSNWLREPQSTCTAHRCVYLDHSPTPTGGQDLPKWTDTICYARVEGYLCKFSFRGMCDQVSLAGPGSVLYVTPFNAESSSLALVPFGSMATVRCESGSSEFVMCVERSPGVYGWVKDDAFCAGPSPACRGDNGGCAHQCVGDGPNGDYHCRCGEGHRLGPDRRSCVARDPCEGHPCQFGCTGLPSGFRCTCPLGFELAENQRDCADTDECARRPCDQLCFNSVGSFRCECVAGYVMAGAACRDVDECLERGPCQQSCRNTDGSYRCDCGPGYAAHADGRSCLDVDECLERPCDGPCANTEGGFECSCLAGYTLHEDHVSCVPPSTPVDSWDLTTPQQQQQQTAGLGQRTVPAPAVGALSPAGDTHSALETAAGQRHPPAGGNLPASGRGDRSPSTVATVTRTQTAGVAGTPGQVVIDGGQAWLLACVLGSAAAALLLACLVALVLCRRKRSSKGKSSQATSYYSWMPAAGSSPLRALRKPTSVASSTSADKPGRFEESQTEV